LKRLVALAMPLAGLARAAYWFVFRPRTRGAKVILVNAGEVLLLRHTYEPGLYGLPGGGLDAGEDPIAGLRREVSEELGVELGDVRLVGVVESDAEYKRDTVHVFTAELPQRDGLAPDPIEISELRWASPLALPAVGPVTDEILRLFQARGRLR
jgi:8-oxo-dGTP pyrophosphatase MutT (NUDIX family)